MKICTTTITVEICDRKPTVEDVQDALNILRAEGIPDTFEVEILSREEVEYAPDKPRDERKTTRTFRMSAERAAKTEAAR